jgi:hypothetical protein
VTAQEQMMRDLLRRVTALERQQVRLRIGEVTDLAPLDVALGGSTTSYEDVSAIGPVADGEQVAALMSGGNLLVLGRLLAGVGARFGSDSCTFPGGSQTSSSRTITHELGRTPDAVLLSGVGHTHVVSSLNVGATTLDVRISTRDESSPAAAATSFFYWLAL